MIFHSYVSLPEGKSFFTGNPPWILKSVRGNGGAFPLPQLDKIASTGNMKNLKCHQFGKWVKGKSHRILTVPKYAILFGAGLSRSICELPWFWVPELLDALVYAVSQCEYLWNRMRFLFFLYPHSFCSCWRNNKVIGRQKYVINANNNNIGRNML